MKTRVQLIPYLLIVFLENSYGAVSEKLLSHDDKKLSHYPLRYLELLPYVQQAPDQGETTTCLFMANTGAVELLLNQKYGIKDPILNDQFDLSERFPISASYKSKNWWHVAPLEAFNLGYAIHHQHLPFQAWLTEGIINWSVWNFPKNFFELPRLTLTERFESETLFVRGKKWATYVVKDEDLEVMKKAIVKNNAPLLVNYNDEGWWHVVLIVGYDDELEGECYFTPQDECKNKGAFLVRDSNGKRYEARSYDWFRVNGNAAFVITRRE